MSASERGPKNGKSHKFFFERYLPLLVFVALGYTVADIIILSQRHRMLPSEPPPSRPQSQTMTPMPDKSEYTSITTRNIFSSDGLIPDALRVDGKPEERPEDAPPVASSLPLTLKGTIVHSNPQKSIANIEVKSKNQTLAYGVGKEIEGLATLQKVERSRIIIRNMNSNRLEFIDMKIEGGKISFSTAGKTTPTAPANKDIQQVAPNRFEIKKTDLQKYLSDTASILQQASMVPVRAANGEIDCYKFIGIQPGSVYTSLGFQVGDCLKEVNGEKIDSPAKAMEMYNSLKNAPNIKILMTRDGREQESDYTVK
jgi:general secretion pathway protein C